FCLDVYEPWKKARGGSVSDEQIVSVAKRASLVIALFSFVVAPLLQFAPQGLWQIIRIFTGFYNIPVIAIVMVGLFSTHVPAIAAKVVIVFHVVTYGLVKFVFDDVVTLHFIHLYAVLFFLEVAIMLVIGGYQPRTKAWHFKPMQKVDMTPWVFAIPCAVTLISMVMMLYLLFSPVGLVGGLSELFWPLVVALVLSNCLIWWRFYANRPS
ncbi:solute:sodium symporter family transporter, partial [Porticoccaceae bacterium]|nr:solute:sodium symporter family transporter [Porticoccaceae bacterium]